MLSCVVLQADNKICYYDLAFMTWQPNVDHFCNNVVKLSFPLGWHILPMGEFYKPFNKYSSIKSLIIQLVVQVNFLSNIVQDLNSDRQSRQRAR